MTLESLRNKVPSEACDIRSKCRTEADREYLKSLFEREWEVFVIRQDPVTGKPKGETVCCENALSH
ncbi:hypothetical protein BH10ACI2_BH10ACI2_06030 [soil metagenome]